MKRIRHIVLAFVFFLISITIYYQYLKNDIVHTPLLKSWHQNPYFTSTTALEMTVDDRDPVVFGSSELMSVFNSIYAPERLLSTDTRNPILIGEGNMQSLAQTINLGSMDLISEQDKVVLILSPQWFTKSGINSADFSSRFSLDGYINFMKNQRVPENIKEGVGFRTADLLTDDPTMQKRVMLVNECCLSGNWLLKPYTAILSNFIHFKSLQELKNAVAEDKESFSTMQAQSPYKINQPEDMAYLLQQADQDAKESATNNPYFIEDTFYSEKLAPLIDSLRGSMIETSFSVSNEFNDLTLFLDLCRSLGKEPLVVSIPFNGYWYDYTQMPRKERQAYYQRVQKLCQEEGVALADFSSFEYEPYFFEDPIHIGAKGWIYVNQAIYEFYQ